MEHDPVYSPSHYTGGGFTHAECGLPVEVIDITSKLSFTRGNAVKYLLRAGLKKTAGDTAADITNKELEDLEKASWYLDREIDAAADKLEELEQEESVHVPLLDDSAHVVQYGPDHTVYTYPMGSTGFSNSYFYTYPGDGYQVEPYNGVDH